MFHWRHSPPFGRSCRCWWKQFIWNLFWTKTTEMYYPIWGIELWWFFFNGVLHRSCSYWWQQYKPEERNTCNEDYSQVFWHNSKCQALGREPYLVVFKEKSLISYIINILFQSLHRCISINRWLCQVGNWKTEKRRNDPEIKNNLSSNCKNVMPVAKPLWKQHVVNKILSHSLI